MDFARHDAPKALQTTVGIRYNQEKREGAIHGGGKEEMRMIKRVAAVLDGVSSGYMSLWRKLKGWRLFLFYIAHYTLLFAVLRHFMFLAFTALGRSFSWNVDGAAQHYVRLMYIRDIWRESIGNLLSGKGWHLPLYDFSAGPALMDTQTGLPQLFAALWPFEDFDAFYDLYAVGNFYWMGFAFSVFGFYWKQKPSAVLTGAISYAFCGAALFAGVQHPHFAVPMVLLPVLLVGAERVLRGERAFVFTLAVFLSLSAQWGAYFSFMQAVFVMLYVAVRFFELYASDRPRQMARVIERLALWGGIAVLLAAPSWLPALIHIMGADRVGNAFVGKEYPGSATGPMDSAIRYGLSYYWRFLGQFIVSPMEVGCWTFLGFSVLTLPAVILLFVSRRREGRGLRLLFLALSAMLWIPAVAYVMSGFSNVVNRFSFGYAFCAAAILMFMLERMPSITAREWALCGAGMALYCAVAWFVGVRRGLFDMRGILALVAAVALLGLCYALGARGTRLLPVALAVTCLSVCYTAYWLYDAGQLGYVNEFFPSTSRLLAKGQYASLAKSDTVAQDDAFFRVAGDSISDVETNAAFSYGLNGLSMYPYYGWSNAYVRWIEEMELTRYENKHRLYGRMANAPLLTLSGVKYCASRSTAQKPRPYGFDEVDSVAVEESVDVILKNEHALPIGYTYDCYMTRAFYDALDSLGKQQAQLSAVLLEETPTLAGLAAAEPANDARQIPYEIIAMDGLSWADGMLTVERANATMTLSFAGVPGTETYLRIVDHDLIDGASLTYWTVSASSGELAIQARFFTEYDVYSHGQHTQMLNFGYSEDGLAQFTITFPYEGIWRLGDVQVWCQPVDGYAEKVAALGKETLQNVVTDWHSLRGNITVSGDKVLVVAIPYADGWSAYVDGQRTALVQANTAFMAVELPEGSHEVELRYALPGLSIGLAMCAAGAIGLAALLALCAQEKKKNRKNGSFGGFI